MVLASGTELFPDYLVLATGSGYPFPAKPDLVIANAENIAGGSGIDAGHLYATTGGNPFLVEGQITNYDLRWEWFFSPSELVWVSGFYGSGKSHLVRVLEQLWRDLVLPGLPRKARPPPGRGRAPAPESSMTARRRRPRSTRSRSRARRRPTSISRTRIRSRRR